MEFFGFMWRAGREAATKKKQVVEAVRASCEGTSRDERRALFERELDRHGAPRDPIWVERELDELELSAGERPFKRARDVALAATALGHAAKGFADPPAWMSLPEDVGRSAWARRSEKTVIGIEPAQRCGWSEHSPRRRIASATRRRSLTSGSTGTRAWTRSARSPSTSRSAQGRRIGFRGNPPLGYLDGSDPVCSAEAVCESASRESQALPAPLPTGRRDSCPGVTGGSRMSRSV